MTPQAISNTAELIGFASTAIFALGLATYVLAFGRRILTGGWRGTMLRLLHGFGWLFLGLGLGLKTGIIAGATAAGPMLIMAGAFLLVFVVMAIYRAKALIPGHTPGTTF